MVGLLCSILLLGCSSKVSEETFELIHAGMTPAEVRAVLGEPTESASMGVGPLVGTTATWRGEGGTITIQFVNEKVFAKQFVKPTL
jgi:hypothetical protein